MKSALKNNIKEISITFPDPIEPTIAYNLLFSIENEISMSVSSMSDHAAVTFLTSIIPSIVEPILIPFSNPAQCNLNFKKDRSKTLPSSHSHVCEEPSNLTPLLYRAFG